MFDYLNVKTFRRWRCACWLLYHPFTNCCPSLHPSIWVYRISIRGFFGMYVACIFASHKYMHAGKNLDTIQSTFCHTCATGLSWAHTMDMYRSSECSAQCFHLLSTTPHLVHFKWNLTNPAPDKNTNFQSLFNVSRQKLRLFWEAIHTAALSCVCALLFHLHILVHWLKSGFCPAGSI